MSQRISQVPAPIATHEGCTYLQWDDLLITLFPFMPGRILDLNNAAECINAAQMLARLHQAGLEYPDLSPRPNKPPIYELDWENNHWWRWHEVEKLLFHQSEAFLETVSDPEQRTCTEQIFAKRSVIAQEREALRDWVAALHKSERAQGVAPAQRDFWCNNLLVKEGQISAVLDWDGCRAEWLVYDLSRAVGDFCMDASQHTLDCQKAMDFLRAYQAADGPVQSTEFALLIPFIQCICMIEVLLGLQDATEVGLNDHVLHNLVTLENLRDVKLVL